MPTRRPLDLAVNIKSSLFRLKISHQVCIHSQRRKTLSAALRLSSLFHSSRRESNSPESIRFIFKGIVVIPECLCRGSMVSPPVAAGNDESPADCNPRMTSGSFYVTIRAYPFGLIDNLNSDCRLNRLLIGILHSLAGLNF